LVESLVEAYRIEREFHARILAEPDAERRKELYREVYARVHPLYGVQRTDISRGNPKDRVVRLFRRELSGRSILEVGCGEGYFLRSVARLLPHKELVGLDVSTAALPGDEAGISFVNADVINFNLDRKFDVVYSEHVIEHLAPMDLTAHLESVNSALAADGTFIVSAPNKLFGPSDVTRIVDYTYTNRIAAQGTHLNEPTYTELIPVLREHGFSRFRTVLPVPRIKYLFPWLRLDPGIPMAVEQSGLLMKLLHAVRYRSQCIARFDTVLICKR
jgi:2-polyprenyl-3-methyl-5-hydroxy-6-metoxy-1,4-benzoquinol methylase